MPCPEEELISGSEDSNNQDQQKRSKRGEVMPRPEEELGSDIGEDSNGQSDLDEPFEEQNEHGEDVEEHDWENDNIKEELPDLINADSIDIKDNILAYCADDARSPQTLLSELLDLEAE